MAKVLTLSDKPLNPSKKIDSRTRKRYAKINSRFRNLNRPQTQKPYDWKPSNRNENEEYGKVFDPCSEVSREISRNISAATFLGIALHKLFG